MGENLCTQQVDYLHYLLAFIPQLVYYQYRMITVDERKAAMERYYREICYVQEREIKMGEESSLQQKIDDNVALLSKSYVEYLDDDALFHQLFKYDKVGRQLSAISDDTENAFDEYRRRLFAICHDLYHIGLKEQCNRMDEIELLISAVNKAKDIIQRNAQTVTRNFAKRKTEIITELKGLTKDIQDDIEIDTYHEQIERAHHLTATLDELILKSWSELMYAEITLHDQIEDLNEAFKINMTSMVNTFLEIVQNNFSLMRNVETEYNDSIEAAILYFMSGFGDDMQIPTHLLVLCKDRDILGDNLAVSHDRHLQAINAREDSMLKGLRNWLETYIAAQAKCEAERNWHQILEISHFLDHHGEFDSSHLVHQLQLSSTDGPNKNMDDNERN